VNFTVLGTLMLVAFNQAVFYGEDVVFPAACYIMIFPQISSSVPFPKDIRDSLAWQIHSFTLAAEDFTKTDRSLPGRSMVTQNIYAFTRSACWFLSESGS
jgi:hypothetical protein